MNSTMNIIRLGIEINLDGFNRNPRRPTWNLTGHGISKTKHLGPVNTGYPESWHLTPCARYKPVSTVYPEKDTIRTSSDALMAFFTKQPKALQASLWNISLYKIQCTWCSIGICHLIPKLRANISSYIWTSSLIPSNILEAPSMDKTFKYISLKTLVHRYCH